MRVLVDPNESRKAKRRANLESRDAKHAAPVNTGPLPAYKDGSGPLPEGSMTEGIRERRRQQRVSHGYSIGAEAGNDDAAFDLSVTTGTFPKDAVMNCAQYEYDGQKKTKIVRLLSMDNLEGYRRYLAQKKIAKMRTRSKGHK